MRPSNLRTKIFLDSGDPAETREAIRLLGSLDGQTTNPTLISKHPAAKARLLKGDRFAKEEILSFYKDVVTEISGLIPEGSVSIEVYADHMTSADSLVDQGREMLSWIPNAHIKYPTTAAGLEAASSSIREGMRVNMTLVFSQAQAAAVYSATRGAKRGDVFLSPFVGRLDDVGQNGMDLVRNCIHMYVAGDRHVEVLAASIRSLEHLFCAVKLGSDIVTAPLSILKAWAEAGIPMPDADFSYEAPDLKTIPYQELDLGADVPSFDVHHELTDKGIERFAADWNSLLR